MNDNAERIDAVVRHFNEIERTHMRGLPILNSRLAVEAVAARELREHLVLVLISPWFMNLVLLPGTDEWHASHEGDSCEIEFPCEALEFNVCHDADLGTFLTAVLFRTVSDFPDQATARDVAMDVMRRLFALRSSTAAPVSRRSLLTGLGNS